MEKRPENKPVKHIVITGPESTGKSWLAQKLAQHYNTVWVPEYAREYLQSINRPYQSKDILYIAKKQRELEQEMKPKANKYLFSDTSMLVTKIWSEYVFGKVHPWIINALNNHPCQLYLLCNIDIPWQEDPLREHPNARKELLNLYIRELTDKKLPFEMVQGMGNLRIENAIHSIQARLSETKIYNNQDI